MNISVYRYMRTVVAYLLVAGCGEMYGMEERVSGPTFSKKDDSVTRSLIAIYRKAACVPSNFFTIGIVTSKAKITVPQTSLAIDVTFRRWRGHQPSLLVELVSYPVMEPSKLGAVCSDGETPDVQKFFIADTYTVAEYLATLFDLPVSRISGPLTFWVNDKHLSLSVSKGVTPGASCMSFIAHGAFTITDKELESYL